ncbi:MAG: penicillin-binding transpeptidase domain-containing protein, partial [Bacilli bacterium]
MVKGIPYEGKRGRILDRNGKVLAYNITAPTIMAIPVQIDDKVKTAKALAEVLDMREEKVFQLISKRELKVYIAPQGRKITEELAKKVYDLNLPGIVVTEDSKRFYPNGSFLSHVLGFAGSDNQGLTGIELIHDEMLTVKSGNVSFTSDNQGREMPGQKYTYLPPEDGKDLVLTIDKMIQSFIEREMKQAMLKYQADGAMAIAMNPKTGEIYGMASYPNYDPGNFQDYPSEIYNRNQAIWRSFEPGSTFKIITLAAALEEKKVNLKEAFYDPGFITVAGQRLRCWKRQGHGSESFLEVVENSCNPGFVTMGQRL